MNVACRHSESQRRTSAYSRTTACGTELSWARLSSIIHSTRMFFTSSSALKPGNRWSSIANRTPRRPMRSVTSSRTTKVTTVAPSPSPASSSKTRRRRSSSTVNFRCKRRQWVMESKVASWRKQLSALRDYQWRQNWTRSLSVTLTIFKAWWLPNKIDWNNHWLIFVSINTYTSHQDLP